MVPRTISYHVFLLLVIQLIVVFLFARVSCKHLHEVEPIDTNDNWVGGLSFPFQKTDLHVRSLHEVQETLGQELLNALLLLKEVTPGTLTLSASRGKKQPSIRNLLGTRYDPNSTVSEACLNDMDRFAIDVMNGEMYALQMLDADAKIPSGLMNGNFLWYGDYKECQSAVSTLDSTGGKQIHGRHCILSLKTNGRLPIVLTIGTCVPDSCNGSLVKAVGSIIVTKLAEISKVGPSVADAYCYEENTYKPRDIVALVICCIVVLLVLLGTVTDVLCSHLDEKLTAHQFEGLVDDDSNIEETTGLLSGNICHNVKIASSKYADKIPVKLLLAFSIISNGKKLFNTKTATGPLTSVNGLRVLSMWWVIQGHGYAFVASFIDNQLEAIKIVKRFSFQPILNGTFSVDTFFFMSGLLVVYLTLKELSERDGKLNWALFYFHRYWRLTPTYAFVLMIFATLLLHLGDTPTVYSVYTGHSLLSDTVVECRSTWWANLLYLNNYYPNYGNLGKQCMGWTWYLANDMQFYIISPIFIWLLYRFRRVGILVTSSMIFCCILIRLLLVVIYDIPTLGGQARKHTGDIYAQNDLLYNKSYTRIAPFLVGVLLGFILHRTHCRVRLHKIFVATGWCVAIITGLSVVYGMYEYNHDGKLMNEGAAIVYISTARFLWGLALAWVIFACATGYGGLVNQFLSWKIWAPLGRLTYSAYLVHPIIIFMYYMNRLTPIHFTDVNMIYLFFGHLVASYFAAFIVSMAVEAPMMSLEKLVFKRQ